MSDDGDKTMDIDLGEFLGFYLLDSSEQIERLGAGLLQLEKEGGNIGLINDLFRSAHSLKGASGTMGFTPIVAMTHAAEDLLDRLRQGKIEVSPELIDVLLAVTDRVKEMLSQVEQHQEISIGFEDLVSSMRALLTGEKPLVSKNTPLAQAEPQQEEAARVIFVPLDFSLSEAEAENMSDAHMMGHGVYQIDVTLAPETLMKAVRAVMATQRLEGMGTVIKILPSVEDLEASNSETFSLLVLCDEPVEEIRKELLEVSELVAVQVNDYRVSDERVAEAGAEATRPVETVRPSQEIPVESETIVPVSVVPVAVAVPVPVPVPINQAVGGESNAPVHTIRVDTVRMDNLINLVGEMVITRTRLVQIGSDLKAQYSTDGMVNNLNEANVYLGRLMNDLQESVMRLRMVAIGTVFSRFPRLVRDLAKKTGKEMELILKGEDTELDKTVVEVIGDPLMHLIRNSVDHGIESPEERRAAGKPELGTITLDAYHEGNHIAIIISDDGAGLDLVKIRGLAVERGLIGEKEELSDSDISQLIFLPGFSTAETVTDISGRGVGMDVVKKALTNLGGLVDITTRKGKGTTFTIRLPLTLAIIQALLVEVGEEIYAVPLSSVLETLLVKLDDIKTVGGLPMVQLRGNTLPLISLQEKFDLPTPESTSSEVYVVVVGFGEKALGLIVDELRGQQEVVIKSLGDFLNNLPGIAGATILGDGKVTLILDVGSLIQDVLVKKIS
ncbi:MAG TPA: chemotaxis protein CheA [Desulfosporosinus sp.]|nr:chemotaxis protein CheA [Desulfosporosinus sp.]